MLELNATIDTISGSYGGVIVFHATTPNGKRLRMVGDKESMFSPGEFRTFHGDWEKYKNAGNQFRIKESTIASVTDAIVKTFLMNQTGIGDKTVDSLISTFGSELPKLLDTSDSDTLMKAPKVGEAIALQAIQSWQEQGAKKELIDYITKPLSSHPHLISKLTKAVMKAHEFYQHKTLDKIKGDPYRLWSFCSWFETDRLGLALGIKKDDRRRLVCAIEESLYRLYCNGHTTPAPKTVNEELNTILDGEYHCMAIYEASRDDALLTRRIIVREEGWSLPSAYIMETYVRKELFWRIGKKCVAQQMMLVDNSTHGYLLPGNYPLDSEQEEAVNAILNNDIVAVVGAAGTGKTSVLHAANDLLHRTGRHVLQVALSGKAAQRLAHQTEQEAYTIESLLGKINASPLFLDKYDMPVLFIDEASMVDLPLMYRVLKAFEKRDVKIVFIGDRGQLAPIGTGLVFHKLIESDKIPVITLLTNYRTIAGSTIPEIAEVIREGMTFTTSKDVCHIESITDDITNQVVEQYLMNRNYDSVQIVSATRKVMARSNRKLQSILLGDAPVVASAPEFRIGDKIIYKKNDQHLGLVNGSVGTIVKSEGDVVVVNKEFNETVPADMVVEFKREGRIPLLLSQIKNMCDGEWYIQLSYALTCHQGQGSEFDCVIVALEQTQLLDRSWLYTAATRAKQKLIFVGDSLLIQQAINEGNKADKRQVGITF